MASSPLLFPFPPTTTSYRAGAIFNFEMCQSAPRHPVLHNGDGTIQSYCLCVSPRPYVVDTMLSVLCVNTVATDT